MRLALMECGRKLGTYLRKRQRMRREGERRDVFERYIGEISKAVNAITGADARKLYDALLEQARKRTAQADQVLDEDGKVVKDEPMDEDGVIVVESAIAPAPASDRVPAPPMPDATLKRGKAEAKPAAPAKARGKRGGDGPSLF
jgi:DNA topoisomerase-6 subunit B